MMALGPWQTGWMRRGVCGIVMSGVVLQGRALSLKRGELGGWKLRLDGRTITSARNTRGCSNIAGAGYMIVAGVRLRRGRT